MVAYVCKFSAIAIEMQYVLFYMCVLINSWCEAKTKGKKFFPNLFLFCFIDHTANPMAR